jgi:hypothetical protein
VKPNELVVEVVLANWQGNMLSFEVVNMMEDQPL